MQVVGTWLKLTWPKKGHCVIERELQGLPGILAGPRANRVSSSAVFGAGPTGRQAIPCNGRAAASKQLQACHLPGGSPAGGICSRGPSSGPGLLVTSSAKLGWGVVSPAQTLRLKLRKGKLPLGKESERPCKPEQNRALQSVHAVSRRKAVHMHAHTRITHTHTHTYICM